MAAVVVTALCNREKADYVAGSMVYRPLRKLVDVDFVADGAVVVVAMDSHCSI